MLSFLDQPENMSGMTSLPPTSTEPEDFLSTSASLFDILCYVDKEDIPHCKLVNRRINNVIRRNTKRFPIVKACMEIIFTNHEQSGDNVSVKVSIRNEDGWSCIVSERKPIELKNCCDQMVMKSLERYMSIRKKDMGLLQNRCSEDFRSVLEIIFSCYFFKEITIMNGVQDLAVLEEYCASFGDVFKSSRLKCETLFFEGITWQGLTQLNNKLDCSRMHLATMNDDHKGVLSILHCNQRYISVTTKVAASINLPLITDMLKKWEQGDLDCEAFWLSSVGRNLPAAREIYHNLKSMSWFDMTCSIIEDTECEMRFRREMDDKMLCLNYFASLRANGFIYEYYHFTDTWKNHHFI